MSIGLSATPEQRYAALVEMIVNSTEAMLGSPNKKGFGSGALQINKKIFAMLVGGRFVVKLPRERVDLLVMQGEGVPLDTGNGRLMKEWLSLEPGSELDWMLLAREAMEFVAGAR